MEEIKANALKASVVIPKVKEDKKSLQQMIIQLTEQKVEDHFSDKNLDRENEIIKLIGGKEITLAGVKEAIAGYAGEYSPMYTNETEYYSEIYRLNKWDPEEARQFYKKPIVGKYTNEIIYSRFGAEVLPMLQHLNPYIPNGWTRQYRHFQWLTEDAKRKVESFIGEAVTVMKSCDTWYEFRVKYYLMYGVPFQTDAFENTSKIIGEFKSALLH